MNELTPLERSILQFIESVCRLESNFPTSSRIALYFGLDEAAVRRHVSFLQTQGYLATDVAKAPGDLAKKWSPLSAVLRVPLLGRINCGESGEQVEEFSGYVSVPLDKLGAKASSNLFAIEARGDSMIGKEISEGDYVIVDRNKVPRSGDVVAALIGNESTLKTFVCHGGKRFLRPENPKYHEIFPVDEVIVQGVMVLVVRSPESAIAIPA